MAVTIKEYIVLYSSGNTPNLDEVNQKAAEGWELVNTVAVHGVRNQLQCAYFMGRSAGQSTTDVKVGVFTVGVSNNTIIISNHGMVNGTMVRFALGVEPENVLPAPLTAGVYYYVIAARGNDFQVSLIADGSPVDITNQGVGGTNEVWKKA
jgi:hypothetical protein